MTGAQRKSNVIVVHADNDAMHVPSVGHTPRSKRRGSGNAAVVLAVALAASIAAAMVVVGVASFYEVSSSCERGFGRRGVGTPQARLGWRNVISCHVGDGTVDIPMNGPAAGVLVGGIGLLGIVGASIGCRIRRHRFRARCL